MTFRYHNEDHLVERFFELEERVHSIPAHDLRSIVGELCVRCHAGLRQMVNVPTPKGGEKQKEVCWACWCTVVDTYGTGARDRIEKALWIRDPDADLIVPRWQRKRRHGGRPCGAGAAAARADDLRELHVLAPIVERRPRAQTGLYWGFALDCWQAYLHAKIGSYGGVAAYGRRWQPGLWDWWTEWKVRRAIETARQVIGRRASRREVDVVLMRVAAA